MLPYIKKPQVLGVILIALVIPFTYYMVSQQTKSRQDAAESINGNLILNSTFQSIGVEVKNTTAATGTLEFKKTNESSWRKGIEMWQAGGALYGSALLLDPGTTYDVKVTHGSTVAQGQVTTRAENIPPASALQATHYVREDGNDSNSGSSDSPTGAWKTLYKAIKDAPSGAVVQVGPGYHAGPGTFDKDLTRSLPITLKAQFPAMDDNGNVINQGKHSVLASGIYTSPRGSTDQNPGVWQKAPYTGPATGQQFSIWKWNTTQYTPNYNYGIDSASYSTSKLNRGTRLGFWERKSGTATDSSGKVYTLATPEGFAEVLFTNKSYSYGFSWFWGGDMLLRMPKDLDPNNYYIHMNASPGGGHRGIQLNAPNSRVTGFVDPHVRLNGGSHNAVIDHNYGTGVGVYGYQPSTYAKDIVIEYNKFIDTNVWSTDKTENCWNNCPAGQSTITLPWDWIKGNVKLADGSGTPWGRVGSSAESGGVGFIGGGHNVVIRKNIIDGTFNGVGAYNNNFDKYASMNTDIYDNLITRIADDAFEPEQTGINWRMWNNTIKETFIGLSTGPLANGPLYLFRNTFWEVNGLGAGVDNSGKFTGGDVGANGEKGGQIFKYSGNSNPKARVWVINNTFWTGRCCSGGGDQWAGGGSNQENFYLINNIFRTTQYVGGLPGFETFNQFATTDTLRGISRKYFTNVAQYRTDYPVTHNGMQTTSNVAWDGTNGHFLDTALVDNNLAAPSTGNLNLKSGSIFTDKGMQVANIADNYDSKSAFAGSAPDLGATEVGGTGTPLATPTPTTTQTNPTAIPTTTAPTPTLTSPPVGGVNPATTLTVSPGLLAVTATKSYLSTIQITTQNSVTNTDLAFTYNPAIMEVTDVTLGNFLPNAQVVTKTIDNVNGKAFISFYTDSTNAKTGSGNLAYVSWRVKATGSVTLGFDPATTIVYGLGGGNVVSQLVPATYSVTAPTGPTATPTVAVNTPVPPTATITIAPTVVGDPACAIGTASWNLSSVDEGTLVTLRATVTGVNCAGKQISFKVRENDSILEGGLDEDANTQPAAAVVSGSTATTTWIAEWQNDCNGLCNSPEYYFNATVVGGNTVRSADPLLSVQKTETAVTLKLTLPYLSASQDLLNSTVTIRNTQTNTDVSKTVTLVPGTNNTYTGTLQTVLIPGNYAMIVKRHQFLAKRFTFTVGNAAPNLDFSSTPLVGGDIDNNNVINTLDIGKVIEEYSPQADTTAVSDLTRDKRINALDLGVVIENYFKQGETL